MVMQRATIALPASIAALLLAVFLAGLAVPIAASGAAAVALIVPALLAEGALPVSGEVRA